MIPKTRPGAGDVAMKVTVIYESIYGNTAAIAGAIAEGLRTHGEVELHAVNDVPVTADLLVLGAPPTVTDCPIWTARPSSLRPRRRWPAVTGSNTTRRLGCGGT